MNSLDLSAIAESLNEVQKCEQQSQQQTSSMPVSSLLRDKDDLLAEIQMKNAELMAKNKNKIKKWKKAEKSKGYYEKQDMKQKQFKKLKKSKK